MGTHQGRHGYWGGKKDQGYGIGCIWGRFRQINKEGRWCQFLSGIVQENTLLQAFQYCKRLKGLKYIVMLIYIYMPFVG